MTLDDLARFASVVEHGGFSRAARALGVPKSTLSKRVAALEAALGVRLIQRTSRSFAVTELGREIVRHAAAVRIEAETVEAIVQGRLAAPRGTVRITASVPTAQLRLAPLLPRLARAWPEIRIELCATDRFVDLAQEGFDIGVRDHFGPLPDSGLIQRRVAEDPVILVASRRYLARHGRPRRPEDLARHDAVATGPSALPWTLFGPDGATAAATPRMRFAADESTVIASATAHGLGIACLPLRLRGRGLVRVLPAWTAGQVTTTLLVPHRRGALPSVRVILDALAARLA